MLKQKHDNNAALQQFELALRLRPEYVEARYNRAILLQQTGEKEIADRELNQLARLSEFRQALSQASEPYMTMLVRTAGNPKLWASPVHGQVATVDRNQPPHDLMTLEDLRTQSLTPRRVNMLLVGAFAALGLILASVGIYGVVSYSVSQRTNEIGIRMALGAEPGDVLKIVVGRRLRSVLIGAGIGVAASLGLTRSLQTLLFGVKPTDPATFVGVALILLMVAGLACYIPARRATEVDPIVALRYE